MTATPTEAPVSSPPGNGPSEATLAAARHLFDALFTTAVATVGQDAAIVALGERIEALEIALQRGRDLRAVLLARRWHGGATYEALAALVGRSGSRIDQLVKRGCDIARLPRKRAQRG